MKSVPNKKIHILLTVLIRFNLDKTFPFLFHCAFLICFYGTSFLQSTVPCCVHCSLYFSPLFSSQCFSTHLFTCLSFSQYCILIDLLLSLIPYYFSPALSIVIRLYTRGLQENINGGKSTKRHNIPEILKAQGLTGTQDLSSRSFDAVG